MLSTEKTHLAAYQALCALCALCPFHFRTAPLDPPVTPPLFYFVCLSSAIMSDFAQLHSVELRSGDPSALSDDDAVILTPTSERSARSRAATPRNVVTRYPRIAAAVSLATIVIIVIVIAVAVENSEPRSNRFHDLGITYKPLPSPSTNLERLAFGSCAKQWLPHPFWDTAAQQINPDALILMGDNVYGDHQNRDWVNSGCLDSKCTVLAQAYRQLGQKPSFRGFAALVPMLTTWDDHDYGLNDGGASFVHREEAQRVYNEFWQIRDERSRRPGVYASVTFGESGKKVQIILLDCRYFKSAWLKRDPNVTYATPGRYLPRTGSHVTMLGDEQWAWLESKVREKVDLRIVVSSIQVLPAQLGWEGWGMFPDERQRLINLLNAEPARTLFISGDRHVGAFYQLGNLVEITSSSFTHTRAANQTEISPLRLFPLVHVNNIGTVDMDWEQRKIMLRLVRADTSSAGTVLESAGPFDIPRVS